MLDSYKKAYEAVADRIPNWKKINKNTLINLYIENEKDPELANAYISAIICRYWNKLNKYYYTSRNSVNVEDCYDWLIRAILYGINYRPWKDPSNKLYNDPNGPDKVINRCIISTRQGYFQDSNAQKRKVNYGNLSLEGLNEEYEGEIPNLGKETLKTNPSLVDVEKTISKYIEDNNYISAFLLYGMLRYDLIMSKNGILEYSSKNAFRFFRNLDKNFIDNFSKEFKVPEDKLENEIDKINNISDKSLTFYIKRSYKLLKYNKYLV